MATTDDEINCPVHGRVWLCSHTDAAALADDQRRIQQDAARALRMTWIPDTGHHQRRVKQMQDRARSMAGPYLELGRRDSPSSMRFIWPGLRPPPPPKVRRYQQWPRSCTAR